MLRSQDSGQPRSPGGREKITTVATTVNALSGIPSFLLKHLTSLHLLTSQDCTFPLSGESAGAGSSQLMQSEGSLLWGDIDMSWGSIFHVQTHSHSVAQASQKHARGLLPHPLKYWNYGVATPEPLRVSSSFTDHCLTRRFSAVCHLNRKLRQEESCHRTLYK